MIVFDEGMIDMFLGKYDPEKIQQLMEKFGIKSEKLEAKEVVIKLKNGTITMKAPTVIKTYLMGRDVYQISKKEKKARKK